MDSSWTPTVWKNGTDQIALPLSSGYTHANPQGWALDASGDFYVCGNQWGASAGGPAYWKATSGTWGNSISLDAGSYASNDGWYISGIAVDRGNISCTGTTWSLSSGFPSTNGFWGPPAALIYWNGASNAPSALTLPAGKTCWQIYASASVVDAKGNYFNPGFVAADPTANPVLSVPAYWKNGNPFTLDLGSNNGVANDFGRAGGITAGP